MLLGPASTRMDRGGSSAKLRKMALTGGALIQLVTGGCASTSVPESGLARDSASLGPEVAPGPDEPQVLHLPDATLPASIASTVPKREIPVPVRVCVDEQGKVTTAVIDTAAVLDKQEHAWRSALDSTAVAVARGGTYRPATEDGIPKPGCVLVKIVFNNRGKVYEGPVLISMHPADYPIIAREAGEEGTVLVRARVNKEGRVTEAIVFKGAGVAIDFAALEAVRSARFVPAMIDGKPVEVWMIVPIEFDLGH